MPIIGYYMTAFNLKKVSVLYAKTNRLACFNRIQVSNIEINKIGDKIHKVVNSEKPYLEYKKLITNKNVGSYFMGSGKGFHIHLENKPNWLHRKCMEIFFGWKWNDNTNK